LALILADTDVLIDFLAGIEAVRQQIAEAVETEMLQTTAITAFELLSGAREGKRGDAVRKLVQDLPVAPLDRNAAEQAAAVRRQLELSGEPIGMADSLIAGIALANGSALFTRNRRHFEKVPGLRLIDTR
jgi:tRNA(fMet)-specific endonuclease VapC